VARPREIQLATVPSGTASIRPISAWEGGPNPEVEAPERCPEVGIGRVAPWLRLDPPDGRKPAAPAAKLVESEPQRDRVQPRPDIRTVEPIPRAVGFEVRILRDVLGVALAAEHEDEATDEVRIVRPDGSLEGVPVALRSRGMIRRRNVDRGHGIGWP
jgi:hypothetical protein